MTYWLIAAVSICDMRDKLACIGMAFHVLQTSIKGFGSKINIRVQYEMIIDIHSLGFPDRDVVSRSISYIFIRNVIDFRISEAATEPFGLRIG